MPCENFPVIMWYDCLSSYFPCRAVLDVVVKPSSGLSGPRQRQLEQLISGCCGAVIRTKAHPHTAISITLQVENDGGSVSDTIITSWLLTRKNAC